MSLYDLTPERRAELREMERVATNLPPCHCGAAPILEVYVNGWENFRGIRIFCPRGERDAGIDAMTVREARKRRAARERIDGERKRRRG